MLVLNTSLIAIRCHVMHWLIGIVRNKRLVVGGIEMTLHSQRKSNSSHWKRIRLMVLNRDNYTCQWCGAYGNTADHILPVSKGGSDELENLVCACKKCNYSRQDKLISQMGAGFFDSHSTAMSSRGLISPKNESRSHD
jgi:hypothetical protein